MNMVTTASAPPKCDATNTRIGINEWGTHGIPCQSRRGLRSFVDRTGITRWFCAAPGHRANAERRFGRYPTQEELRVALAIERITSDFNGYMGEDDEEPEFDREGQPEFNGAFR